MSMRTMPRLRSLSGIVAESERTQVALATLAARSRPVDRRLEGRRGDRRPPEEEVLAAFAARLRVGGLTASPTPRDGFVDDLEQEMERAWSERATAGAGRIGGDDSVVSSRHTASNSTRAAFETPLPISHPLEPRRQREAGVDRSVVHRLSRMARRPQATFVAAAAMVLLAMGGLSKGSEGLLVSPTLTPTAGAVSATPSPAPQSGGWLLERDRAPLVDTVLVATARTGEEDVQVSAPGPAPEPRPTPRTAEHSG